LSEIDAQGWVKTLGERRNKRRIQDKPILVRVKCEHKIALFYPDDLWAYLLHYAGAGVSILQWVAE